MNINSHMNERYKIYASLITKSADVLYFQKEIKQEESELFVWSLWKDNFNQFDWIILIIIRLRNSIYY